MGEYISRKLRFEKEVVLLPSYHLAPPDKHVQTNSLKIWYQVCVPQIDLLLWALLCNNLQIAYQWLEFHWWRSCCAWVHQLYGRFEFVLVAMGSGMRLKCIFNDLKFVIPPKTNYTLRSHARIPSIVCSVASSCFLVLHVSICALLFILIACFVLWLILPQSWLRVRCVTMNKH